MNNYIEIEMDKEERKAFHLLVKAFSEIGPRNALDLTLMAMINANVSYLEIEFEDIDQEKINALFKNNLKWLTDLALDFMENQDEIRKLAEMNSKVNDLFKSVGNQNEN